MLQGLGKAQGDARVRQKYANIGYLTQGSGIWEGGVSVQREGRPCEHPNKMRRPENLPT